jgi:hypothetical protein
MPTTTSEMPPAKFIWNSAGSPKKLRGVTMTHAMTSSSSCTATLMPWAPPGEVYRPTAE